MRKTKHKYNKLISAFLHSLDFICISLLTQLIVLAFIQIPLSVSYLNNSGIEEQFNLIDAYYSIHYNPNNRLNVYPVDNTPITIIDISDCYRRDSIAQIINDVKRYSPKVIGLDVIFNKPVNPVYDSLLADAVSAEGNVVVTNILSVPSKDNQLDFSQLDGSFFAKNNDDIPSGFSNIILEGNNYVCRYFADVMYYNGSSQESFASEITKIASRDDYHILKERDNEEEIINFGNKDYITIDYRMMDESYIKDKIVLIGDVNSSSDQHNTSIDYKLSGVELQGYILSTIIGGDYINQMSRISAWLLSFLITSLFVALLWMMNKNSWSKIAIPLAQVLFMLFFVFISYRLFIFHNYYIKVIYLFLSIGFASFMYELYYKIKSLIFK